MTAALALALVAACTAGPRRSAPVPSVSRAPAAATAVGPAEFALIARPAAYDRDEALLLFAEQRLSTRCMESRHFRYPEESREYLVQADDAGSPAWLRVHGYGLYDRATGRPSAEQSSAADAYLASLPPARQEAFDRALFGTRHGTIALPDGKTVDYAADGCIGTARRQLYGTTAVWAAVSHVPQSLNSVLADLLAHDPGFASLMRAWSACMKRKGYDYLDPNAPALRLRDAYRKQGATPALHRLEMRTAVADADCADAERIPAKVVELKRQLLDRLPRASLATLPTLARERRAAVARAHRIVDGDPAPA